MVPSSSEVNAAFPGERPWVVAQDRLFTVVARAASDGSRDYCATAAARRPTRVGNDDDEMEI